MTYTLDNIFQNFINGSKAGICAGFFIAPFEYLKIAVQTNKDKKFIQIIMDSQLPKRILKTIIPFSCNFGAVCAIEFSVNDYFIHRFGTVAGLSSSAITGALFLTVADHLMLRQEKHQAIFQAFKQLAGKKLFTGFIPTLAREIMFISSVLHIGPYVGSFYAKLGEKNYNAYQDFAGRVSSGLVITLLSQPFDSLARQLQLRELEKKSTKILDCLKDIQEQHKSKKNSFYQHVLLKGALPRMVLGSFGGALAGGFFDHFKNKKSFNYIELE